jgi:site-specific recombinase XerD
MDSLFSELLLRVVDAYRRALAQSPSAREWLAGRGIRDATLLERFQVGYSEGRLSAMARGEVLGRLQALGLLDSEGRERFSGSIVVPVFDDSGQVVQLAGYSPDGAVTWLFPGETPGFWNADAFRSGREIAIVSDPLAGLVEIGAGREAVVAPGGPGMPLGQGAKDQILAQPAKVTLLGGEGLRPELETLGVLSKKVALEDASVERASDGFIAAFPRRLRFAVQGLSQDSARHLRASVRVFRKSGEGKSPASPGHLDTLDLYHARSRTAFAKTAACLLGEDPILFEEFTGRIVGLAEEFLREREKAAPPVVLSEGDRNQALRLLRDVRYPESVVEDLTRLGYVGEAENKLIAYLASMSRKLEDPLSILVVSRSAAGKSTLSEAIAALAPTEDVLRFTRLTAQTLYYQKPDSLRHKMVVIEEEKGVEDAAYALRVLQSAKHLSLSTASGKGDARRREVKGPVSLFVTTTRTDLDEETAGRFLTLSVDESKEQTRAILAAQREAEARSPEERERLLRLHQNAQRLLGPVRIVNPYAPRLTFPDDRLSARRDHGKYLGLIRAVAFARQFQREAKEGTVEVMLEDIALANRLAPGARALALRSHAALPPASVRAPGLAQVSWGEGTNGSGRHPLQPARAPRPYRLEEDPGVRTRARTGGSRVSGRAHVGARSPDALRARLGRPGPGRRAILPRAGRPLDDREPPYSRVTPGSRSEYYRKAKTGQEGLPERNNPRIRYERPFSRERRITMKTTDSLSGDRSVTLGWAIEELLAHERILGKSASTLKSHENALRQFGKVWGERDLREATPRDLEDYARGVLGKVSKETSWGYLSAVKALFGHLAERGVLLVDPARNLPMPRMTDRPLGRVLSGEEVKRLLESPDLGTQRGLRDRALLELLYSTGLRASEVRNVTTEDLGEDALTVREGKGRKDRVVPMGKMALSWVARYVKEGRPNQGSLPPEGEALFLGLRGRPLGTGHLRVILRDLGLRVGIRGVTCHAIRRTMATDLLRAGANPKEVSAILGHGDLRSLSRYVRIAAAEVKATHRATHPREQDQ